MIGTQGNTASSPVTHVVSLLLVVVTAILLCFGALVTTYDAAMAVPDWPGTFGHNMFLFPASEWIGGPWDLFLEHGHRLLGATVGLLSLMLAAVCFRWEKRGLVRGLAVAAVILVILQGVLGGMRVLLDDKTIAKVHACTGPLFFGVAIAVATLTGRGRQSAGSCREVGSAVRPWLGRLSAALVLAAYAQLVAGAQLRHVDAATMDPFTFRGLVILHLVGAAVVMALAVAAAAVAWAATVIPASDDRAIRGPREMAPAGRRHAAGDNGDGDTAAGDHAEKGREVGLQLGRPVVWSTLLLLLVAGQIVLGAAAWLANWGIPDGWLGRIFASWVTSPIEARSLWNASVVTGHVVLGMMIFGMSVVLAITSGTGLRTGESS